MSSIVQSVRGSRPLESQRVESSLRSWVEENRSERSRPIVAGLIADGFNAESMSTRIGNVIRGNRQTVRGTLNLSGGDISILPANVWTARVFKNTLQVLDLSDSSNLRGLPDTIGALTSLRKLNLSGCSHLEALPDTIGSLTALRECKLIRCSYLTVLPDTIGALISLETLDISSCVSLTRLPDTIGRLKALKKLDVADCERLTVLPDTIGSLTALDCFKVASCCILTALPETIGALKKLEHFYTTRCFSLTALPMTIGDLTSLRTLECWNCFRLTALPETIGRLTALQSLNLHGCQNLTTLPQTIGSLRSLGRFDLRDTSALRGLPLAIMDLPITCTIELTGSGLSEAVLMRLREQAQMVDYNGPQISHSMQPQYIDERAIEAVLAELFKLADTIAPRDFSGLLQDVTQAMSLKSWLNRLSLVAECTKGGEIRKAFATRVLKYLTLAQENEIFRGHFFNIIDGSAITCGDRVALSIVYLGLKYRICSMDPQDTKGLAEILIKGVWTVELLSAIAEAKVPTLRFFDEIEVYLAYPIQLRERLGIPMDVSDMLYFRCSGVTDQDLEAAAQHVEATQADPQKQVEFLLNSDTWKKALTLKYPSKVAAIEREKAAQLHLANSESSEEEALKKQWDALEAYKTAWGELSKQAMSETTTRSRP